MVFHARAHAAPHGVKRCAVYLEVSRSEGIEVGYSAAVGILRSEDMVVEAALVVIHVGGIRLPPKQMTRELQHVV